MDITMPVATFIEIVIAITFDIGAATALRVEVDPADPGVSLRTKCKRSPMGNVFDEMQASHLCFIVSRPSRPGA